MTLARIESADMACSLNRWGLAPLTNENESQPSMRREYPAKVRTRSQPIVKLVP
jgi:hypothetical protein